MHAHLCTNLYKKKLVVNSYFMNLSFKFHKDRSFRWGEGVSIFQITPKFSRFSIMMPPLKSFVKKKLWNIKSIQLLFKLFFYDLWKISKAVGPQDYPSPDNNVTTVPDAARNIPRQNAPKVFILSMAQPQLRLVEETVEEAFKDMKMRRKTTIWLVISCEDSLGEAPLLCNQWLLNHVAWNYNSHIYK